VDLTLAGQRGVLPALIYHCCDDRIVEDVTWLPLVTASGSVALYQAPEILTRRHIRSTP